MRWANQCLVFNHGVDSVFIFFFMNVNGDIESEKLKTCKNTSLDGKFLYTQRTPLSEIYVQRIAYIPETQELVENGV